MSEQPDYHRALIRNFREYFIPTHIQILENLDTKKAELKRLFPGVLARYNRTEDAWYWMLVAQLMLCLDDSHSRLMQTYTERSPESDLSRAHTLAWITRDILELSVWTYCCISSRQQARAFYEDQNRDAVDLSFAFLRLLKMAETNPQLAQSVAFIENALQSLSPDDAKYTRLQNVAQTMPNGEGYRLLNKICSKFAHPTALVVGMIQGHPMKEFAEDVFLALGTVMYDTSISSIQAFIKAESEMGTV